MFSYTPQSAETRYNNYYENCGRGLGGISLLMDALGSYSQNSISGIYTIKELEKIKELHKCFKVPQGKKLTFIPAILTEEIKAESTARL